MAKYSTEADNKAMVHNLWNDVDNQASIYIASNPVHIEVDYHFIRDMVLNLKKYHSIHLQNN